MQISTSQIHEELTAAILRAVEKSKRNRASETMDTATALAAEVLIRCGLAAPATIPNVPDLEALPRVAGDQLEGTLGHFVLRCLVLLSEEQNDILPNNARVALLCDAVRLARDYEKVALKAEDRVNRITPPNRASYFGWSIVATALESDETPFMVWSHGRRAWFGPPSSAEYFEDIMRAGVYFGEQAAKLERRLGALGKLVPLAQVMQTALEAIPIEDARTVAGYMRAKWEREKLRTAPIDPGGSDIEPDAVGDVGLGLTGEKPA